MQIMRSTHMHGARHWEQNLHLQTLGSGYLAVFPLLVLPKRSRQLSLGG